MMMTPILAFALASAADPVPDPPRDEAEAPIVITGTRLGDARQKLKDCLARKCPPLEDMMATFHYAESLFVSGDYRKARSVISRSIGRNRDEAKRYPDEVAGLYRAHSRLSIHDGDPVGYRRSAHRVVDALKKGLPATDPRILGARLELAKMHARLFKAEPAEALYESIAEDARAIGRFDIAATADLHRGALYHLRGLRKGRELIEEVGRLNGPEHRFSRLAAKLLLARFDGAWKDDTASKRLLEEIAAQSFETPTLIYEPPIKILPGGEYTSWADIGFWIGADGRVEDVAVLRSDGRTDWLAPVLHSISGRIYGTSPNPDQAYRSYRVERFSHTSLHATQKGSRIKVRSRQGRIESLDLSDPNQPGRRSESK